MRKTLLKPSCKLKNQTLGIFALHSYLIKLVQLLELHTYIRYKIAKLFCLQDFFTGMLPSIDLELPTQIVE